MTFAMVLVPLMVAAGGMMDMTRAYDYKNKLQAASDNAALAAASTQGISDDERKELALRVFRKNMDMRLVKKDPQIVIEDSKVTVLAEADMPTSFLQLAGINNVDLDVKSVVKIGYGSLEVALVLDNTKSMKGTKMSTLKSAAGNLIDTLYDAAKPGSIKTTIVPYAIYVNVGTDKRGAFWLDAPEDKDIYHPGGGQCWNWEKYNCRADICTGWNDGKPYTYNCQKCDRRKVGDPFPCKGWTEKIRWHGCVGSRNHPLNVLDESYATNKVPGIAKVYCQRPLTPLTTDKTVLKNEINNMHANVNGTYIPGGLTWGWRALSSIEPYSQGVDDATAKNKKVRKALVLMTDGENTCDPNYSNGKHYCGPGKGNVADQLTAELCDNIKAKGIKVYTVAFEVSDAATKDMLEACATDSSSFFDATDSAALMAAFSEISRSLASLYLAE